MAKNNNLKDFVTDIADAIRAKKGTTDLINPQDFAEEIGAISGGGEGGSNWKYYDVSTLSDKAGFFEVALMCKLPNVIGSMVLAYAYGIENVTAVGFDTNAKLISKDTNLNQTFGEMWESLLPQLTQAGVTEITEEEFYNLTA